jgi:subtilase family serine protease
LTTINPGGCANQVNGDDGEAILDAEYASAAAPSAAIVIASCENILLAIQTLVNSASPPAIMSISYGACEASIGSANNQAFSTAYQTGVAEGMSIFVSAGDGGAAGCDNFVTATDAQFGIAASGFASTPYNVAVGGTDFSDTYAGTNSTYWNSSNTATYGSALSYIPEIPLNNSCGSQLYANYFGFTTTYGSSGLCNSSTASNDDLLNIGAGSGGPSSCATGSGATCQGWPKPTWQSGFLGNPADGVRDLPDVSLFAAAGAWGHAYIFCWSDPSYTADGSAPCTGAPVTWSLGGGTSFASPIWAGIQALVNQRMAGQPQGNPNYRLYQLAAGEYGASGSSTCNASNGNTIGSSCIFYDVTLGDNDVVAHHKRQRPFARDRWQIALVRRCKDVLAQHLSDVPDASAAEAAIIRRASVLIVELELVRHFAAGAR